MTRRSFGIETLKVGAHTQVAVRCGKAGQRALLGTLSMTIDDFDTFDELLKRVADRVEARLAGQVGGDLHLNLHEALFEELDVHGRGEGVSNPYAGSLRLLETKDSLLATIDELRLDNERLRNRISQTEHQTGVLHSALVVMETAPVGRAGFYSQLPTADGIDVHAYNRSYKGPPAFVLLVRVHDAKAGEGAIEPHEIVERAATMLMNDLARRERGEEVGAPIPPPGPVIKDSAVTVVGRDGGNLVLSPKEG